MKNALSLSALAKAIASLDLALQQEKNEFIRDAVIQRFEYSYELCWKTLRRYLVEQTGSKEFNIKDCFREAGKQGLISNVDHWFEYHKARNLTSHTYNESTAEDTYTSAANFLADAKDLLHNLQKATN